MWGYDRKGLFGAIVAGGFLFSSTAATASAQRVDPLAILSVMNGGASASILCGAAAAVAAAAQPGGGCVLPQIDAPPPMAQNAPPQPIPVPPVEAAAGGFGISPLLLGLAAVAAGVGLYIALHHANDHNIPVSPD